MSNTQALLDCAISSWLPQFRHLTFSTQLVPLPPAVADWLVADGISLPPESEAVSAQGPPSGAGWTWRGGAAAAVAPTARPRCRSRCSLASAALPTPTPPRTTTGSGRATGRRRGRRLALRR